MTETSTQRGAAHHRSDRERCAFLIFAPFESTPGFFIIYSMYSYCLQDFI